MANYTFDPTNLSITMADVPVAGESTLDVKDLYSRWKDWAMGTDSCKNPFAFLSVGGQEISATAGTEIPAYIYLANGWHVHPYEADHTVNVTNGVLLVDGGGDPFRDTSGAYTVRVNYQQPVQAITTPGLILDEVIESSITMQAAIRLILASRLKKLTRATRAPGSSFSSSS